MNRDFYIFLSVAVMALVTYLIRMLPMTAFRRRIKSRFVSDILYYIPYAVLAAMTVPAIFFAGASVESAAVGFVIALILAFFERGLLTCAVLACAAAFFSELLFAAV